jgi:uncharacterized protein (TIGR00369 family)
MVCIDKSVAGVTVWTMPADERFSNPAGIVQGGFLAACCDSAMGAAVITWAAGRKVFCANAEMKVSFLAAAEVGQLLTCRSEVISGGRRIAFAEAHVFGADGRELVRASSTYVMTPRDGVSQEPGPGSANAGEGSGSVS